MDAHGQSGQTTKGKALSYDVRCRIMRLLDQKTEDNKKKYTHNDIAGIMNVHKRTISNLVRARKDQGLTPAHEAGGEISVVPLAGKQGGFRFSRMTDAQKDMCVRLALEDPTLTLAQLRLKLKEMYPTLELSETTVWRTMQAADLSYVRSRMKDPRASGTLASKAHNLENEAFIREQEKAKDGYGMLNPYDLFFMDETIIPLNDVARKGWGTSKDPPVIAKAKGKTMNINFYAGLGLVDPRHISSQKLQSLVVPANPKLTDPRGNHMVFVDKQWDTASVAPTFALHWWIRPPTREKAVSSSFLNSEDVRDISFTLFNPRFLLRTHLWNAGKYAALWKVEGTVDGSIRAKYILERASESGPVSERRFDHHLSEATLLSSERSSLELAIDGSQSVAIRRVSDLDHIANFTHHGIFNVGLCRSRRVFDTVVKTIDVRTFKDFMADSNSDLKKILSVMIVCKQGTWYLRLNQCDIRLKDTNEQGTHVVARPFHRAATEMECTHMRSRHDFLRSHLQSNDGATIKLRKTEQDLFEFTSDDGSTLSCKLESHSTLDGDYYVQRGAKDTEYVLKREEHDEDDAALHVSFNIPFVEKVEDVYVKTYPVSGVVNDFSKPNVLAARDRGFVQDENTFVLFDMSERMEGSFKLVRPLGMRWRRVADGSPTAPVSDILVDILKRAFQQGTESVVLLDDDFRKIRFDVYRGMLVDLSEGIYVTPEETVVFLEMPEYICRIEKENEVFYSEVRDVDDNAGSDVLMIDNYQFESEHLEYDARYKYIRVKKGDATYQLVNLLNGYNLHKDHLQDFLQPLASDVSFDIFRMQQLMWLNGVEHRKVDPESGNLISKAMQMDDMEANLLNSKLDELIARFTHLQRLVYASIKSDVDLSMHVNMYEGQPLVDVPRAYYTALGRKFKGGRLESDTGKMHTFLQYLVHVRNYYDQVFDSDVSKTLRMAWDSASVHGRVDVQSQKMSFIHGWAERMLGIQGAIFLPVRNPEYNPVEFLFSYLKGMLRMKQTSFIGEVTFEKMAQLIDEVMGNVTQDMVSQWIKRGCYVLPGEEMTARCAARLPKTLEPRDLVELVLESWQNRYADALKNVTDVLVVGGKLRTSVFDYLRAPNEDLTQLKKELRLYRTIDDVFKALLPKKVHVDRLGKVEKGRTDTLVLNDILTVTHVLFRSKHSLKKVLDLKLMKDHSVVLIKWKSGLTVQYACSFTNVDAETSDRVILRKSGDHLVWEETGYSPSWSYSTMFTMEDVTFRNEVTAQYDNYVRPQYKTIVNLMDASRDEYNFHAFEEYVRLRTDSTAREDVKLVVRHMKTISDFFCHRRSPMRQIKQCLYGLPGIDMAGSVADIVKQGLLLCQPFSRKGDRLKLTSVDGEDGRVAVERGGFTASLRVLRSPQSGLSDYRSAMLRVASVTATSMDLELRNGEILRLENKEMFKLIKLPSDLFGPLMKTPYASSINSSSEDRLKISLVVCLKAFEHEHKVIAQVKTLLGPKLFEEFKDDPINWVRVSAICNDAIVKLRRECKECDTKSLYRRYPHFDVHKVLERFEIEKKVMDSSAEKSVRRWPGYPSLSKDEARQYEVSTPSIDFPVEVASPHTSAEVEVADTLEEKTTQSRQGTHYLSRKILSVEIDPFDVNRVQVTLQDGTRKALHRDGSPTGLEWYKVSKKPKNGIPFAEDVPAFKEALRTQTEYTEEEYEFYFGKDGEKPVASHYVQVDNVFYQPVDPRKEWGKYFNDHMEENVRKMTVAQQLWSEQNRKNKRMKDEGDRLLSNITSSLRILSPNGKEMLVSAQSKLPLSLEKDGEWFRNSCFYDTSKDPPRLYPPPMLSFHEFVRGFSSSDGDKDSPELLKDKFTVRHLIIADNEYKWKYSPELKVGNSILRIEPSHFRRVQHSLESVLSSDDENNLGFTFWPYSMKQLGFTLQYKHMEAESAYYKISKRDYDAFVPDSDIPFPSGEMEQVGLVFQRWNGATIPFFRESDSVHLIVSKSKLRRMHHSLKFDVRDDGIKTRPMHVRQEFHRVLSLTDDEEGKMRQSLGRNAP